MLVIAAITGRLLSYCLNYFNDFIAAQMTQYLLFNPMKSG